MKRGKKRLDEIGRGEEVYAALEGRTGVVLSPDARRLEEMGQKDAAALCESAFTIVTCGC